MSMIRRPTAWRAVAVGCRLAGAVSRRPRLWTARRAYASKRAGRWAQAEAAYTVAVSGDRRGGKEWREPLRPGWCYQLGLCRRRRGDAAGAAEAFGRACELDGGNPQWLRRWGEAAEQSADLPAAVTAYERLRKLQGGGADPRLARLHEALAGAAEESGDLRVAATGYQRAIALRDRDDPESTVQLAAIHDRMGEWDRARRLLAASAGRHPGHAETHRRLGAVAGRLAQWGGSLAGTGFRPEPAGPSRTQARAALERAAELAPPKPVARAALADARLADGDPHGAIEQYEAALRAAGRSDGRWVLSYKHRWQFRLESIYHRLGRPRVEDPLFDCRVQPGKPTATGRVPGLFHARFGFAGLGVSGFTTADGPDQVEILLDGVPLRAVRLSRDGFFRRFTITFKRGTLTRFPEQGVIEVRSPPGGERLRGPGGADRLHLTVPHGDGQLHQLLAAGATIDKKGTVGPSPDELRLRQQQCLEIYSRVGEFFARQLGRPLFLIYGTLLGYYRNGDFIPGDDDFDAGYVSDRTDPAGVKQEAIGLIGQLVHAGFTVSFNRQGRLFRIQLERGATGGAHVDVHPVWFQDDGNVWLHNQASFPSRRQDFLPVGHGKLRGVPVAAPRDSERFLRGNYGPGWQVPDPGFQYYPSDVDPAVRRHLARALITPPEYRALAERLGQELAGAPDAGRFVSIGSQDLYPVDHFID
jgi:tetratricopeptide (TPR) repeat protein